MCRDSEYIRYGTLSLLAAIDLLTGEAIPLVSETHKSSDFVTFLKKLDEHYPKDKIRIILDNHSAHTSKETRNFLATMPEGRFEFVFTPKHGFWLNMIGWYIHFAGSMHIYDRHLAMAEKMLTNRNFKSFVMPRMPENAEGILHNVFMAEEELRSGGCNTKKLDNKYWDDILKVLKIFSQSKRLDRIEDDITEIPDCYRSLLINEKQISDKL